MGFTKRQTKKSERGREGERERETLLENMFALFTPICLCGSALTSMWAEKEAEYAKQLEQRLITLELLSKKDGTFP